MAQLLVRGIDPALLERLRARARRNARSLEAEARVILDEAEPSPEAYERAVRFAAQMRKKYAGKFTDDTTDIINEARNR
jgi:plasmid stability protein